MIIRPPNEKQGCNLNISLSEMPYEAKILHRESDLLLRLIQFIYLFFLMVSSFVYASCLCR